MPLQFYILLISSCSSLFFIEGEWVVSVGMFGMRSFYHHKIVGMSVTILTKEDLQQFKIELLADLAKLFNTQVPQKKKWLKSYEVREMLGISRGTLQNLKDNGTLHPSLVGGLLFYDYDEIFKIMKGGK